MFRRLNKFGNPPEQRPSLFQQELEAYEQRKKDRIDAIIKWLVLIALSVSLAFLLATLYWLWELRELAKFLGP